MELVIAKVRTTVPTAAGEVNFSRLLMIFIRLHTRIFIAGSISCSSLRRDCAARRLEKVPEVLVVDVVVILHFLSFDKGSEGARATIGRGLF